MKGSIERGFKNNLNLNKFFLWSGCDEDSIEAPVAAGKHGTQLEKWVSTYAHKNDSAPKGILIINSFKDNKLEERIEGTFSSQLVAYSTKRDYCLLTTLQLLGLYLECKGIPNQRRL